jgi:hypothetical protein
VLLILTGSPIAALVAIAAIGIASLLLCVWPGTQEDNDYGSPAGPNTLWTIVGAVCAILLSLAGSFSDHNRFNPRQADQPDNLQEMRYRL